MVGGQAEDGLERNMAIKAPVVTEDELIEVGVDVLAAEPMIGAETPALQKGEDPMNPVQGDMRCHIADDARIVPHSPCTRKCRLGWSGGRRSAHHISGKRSHSAIVDPSTAGNSYPRRETIPGSREETTASPWPGTYLGVRPISRRLMGQRHKPQVVPFGYWMMRKYTCSESTASARNTGTTPGTSDAAAGGDEIGERWGGMGDGGAEPGAEVVPE